MNNEQTLRRVWNILTTKAEITNKDTRHLSVNINKASQRGEITFLALV